MKSQIFFVVILAVSALRVQGGGWYAKGKVPTPPGQSKEKYPYPSVDSSTSFSTAYPDDSNSLLSNRALGLWPPSLLTFLTRAGSWSMNIFQAYFLHLGDVDQLISFVNRLDTTFTVQSKCFLVVSYCSTGIRDAAGSSESIVQIFARSVSNICCGTSFSIPSSSVTTTMAPTTGCVAGGVSYQEGQSIPNLQACTTCVCQGGQARCYAVTCPAVACANPVRVSGQCCSQCPAEPVRCTMGGVSYSEGQSVPTTNPCTSCTCRSGQVSCTRSTCPQLQCSNPVYTSGACCPTCPEPLRCVSNGVTYSEGQSVPTSNRCSTCTCRSGQVTCTSVTCPQLQCSNPVYTSGACCPTCPEPARCLVGSVSYSEGQSVPSGSTCTNCTCRSSQVSCSSTVCPQLQCSNPVYTSGACCPSCPEPVRCTLGGVSYSEGQRVPTSDPCTSCTCRSGQVSCTGTTCPQLQCSNPVYTSGACCPTCPEPLRCVVNGVTYSEGQSVSASNPCGNCTCSNGQVTCVMVTCAQPLCSNPVYISGVCCPSCPEPVRCTVNGVSYSEGQSVPSTNPCTSCTCRSGQVSCTSPTCPQLQCSNPVYTSGACCPSCPTTSPPRAQCAELGPQSRIVGGTVASQCEFPSLVGLYRNGNFICGGSILDSTRIMTAAHCVQLSGTFEVHAGKYYTSRTTDMAQNPNLQVSPVSRTVTHPNFISNRLINDVAILHLVTPLNMTSCVMPTCLPTAKDYDFSINCVVAGWGTTAYGGTTPTELRKVILPGYSTDSCLSSFNRLYTANVVPGVICAALPQGGRDACQGDSGGIMLCPSRSGGYKQYGVVSSGTGCASAGSPGLYTDVPHFLDFINNN